MPTLLTIVGPIASGKSTVAAELGERFRACGRPAAVLDLDDHVMTIGGFVGLSPDRFAAAVVVFGDLVGAWLREGFDVVAHGPFFQPHEDAAVVRAAPMGTRVVRVELRCTYEVALARVTADAARRHLSTDAGFLRHTYDRIEQLRPLMHPADHGFDTTLIPWQKVVATLAATVLSGQD